MTTLVLSNSVYFDAAWATPIEPSLTGEAAFYLLDGSEVIVPMMRQTASLGYAEGKGYQAVELAFGGHELSMVILLPGQGELEYLILSLGNRPSGLLEMGHLSSQRLSIWPMPFSQLCRIVSQGSTIGRGGKRWNPRIGASGSSWL